MARLIVSVAIAAVALSVVVSAADIHSNTQHTLQADSAMSGVNNAALVKFVQENWLCAKAKADGTCDFFYDDNTVYEWPTPTGSGPKALKKAEWFSGARPSFDLSKTYDVPGGFAHNIPNRPKTKSIYQCAEFVTRALMAGGYLPELNLATVNFGNAYWPWGGADAFNKKWPSGCNWKVKGTDCTGHKYNLGWTSRNCGGSAGLHEYLRDVKGWKVLDPVKDVDKLDVGVVVFMTSPGHAEWQHVVVGHGKGKFAGHNHAAYGHNLAALVAAKKHKVQAILRAPGHVKTATAAEAWKTEQVYDKLLPAMNKANAKVTAAGEKAVKDQQAKAAAEQRKKDQEAKTKAAKEKAAAAAAAAAAARAAKTGKGKF